MLEHCSCILLSSFETRSCWARLRIRNRPQT